MDAMKQSAKDASSSFEELGKQAVEFAPKLGLAIVVLVVGLCIINCISKAVVRVMEKMLAPKEKDPEAQQAAMNPTVLRFLQSAVSISLKGLLLISVCSMVGISTTSFVAALGASALAIGVALKDLLADLASGVMLLMFHPFKVGDVVQVVDETTVGEVVQVKLFVTELRTPANHTFVIANSKITASVINNITEQPKIRLDVPFMLSHSTDLERSERVLLQVARTETRILQDPAPLALTTSIKDTGVELTARVWVRSAPHLTDWMDVPAALQRAVKLTFDAEGLAFARRWEHAMMDAAPREQAAANSKEQSPPVLLGRLGAAHPGSQSQK